MLDPGLLAAIIANPDDDLPRLQMADWLDERCDPRGEFIRVQIAIANLNRELMSDEYCGSEHCTGCIERRALQDREQELLGHPNCEEWTRQVFPNPNGGFYLYGVQGTTIINHLAVRFQFTRGFVSAITCTAADWLRHADAITAATPLERVTLTTWPTQIRGIAGGISHSMEAALASRWPAIKFTLPTTRPGARVATLAGRDVRAGDMLYANDNGTVRAT